MFFTSVCNLLTTTVHYTAEMNQLDITVYCGIHNIQTVSFKATHLKTGIDYSEIQMIPKVNFIVSQHNTTNFIPGIPTLMYTWHLINGAFVVISKYGKCLALGFRGFRHGEKRDSMEQSHN